MDSYIDDFQDLEELEEDDSSSDDIDEEEITSDRRRIFTDKQDPPVSSLHSRYQQGDLILDPHFQRRIVWDDQRASRLIESVILEIPLPVFYLAESRDGTEEVIDGQQRLKAFFRFLENEYALSGLKARPDLNGAKFKELDKSTQKLVREYSVRTVTFKKESDENLRFEIFERLNTGAVPLNAQELRNCIYRGNYNKLLQELASYPDFMWLMGLKGPEKRMRDVEYVLRFAAFYHATYLKYKPSMARFLNEDMLKFQKIQEKDADELREAFKKTTFMTRSLFGSNAFKRYYRGDEKSRNGAWETKKFNASIYDILMWGFAMPDKDKNRVMANADAIVEAFIMLSTQDDEFIASIERSTSSVKAVHKRFDTWRLTLDAILATTSKQPRCFSRALKQELYKADPTCKICGQHISNIDDAAVDHIKQYWLGGETIPENARLTHRFCNWSRSKTG